jgi:hypothetical protein
MGEEDYSEVNTILDKEVTNLEKKLTDVNTAITSQQRIIQLNDTYSKRMSAYTNIFIGFVVAIGIAIVMQILNNNTPFIPDAVLTIIYILLASLSLIYGMVVLSDIVSRDKNDFDKLDLPPPQAAAKYSNSNSQDSAKSGSSLFELPYSCIGSNCCSIDAATIWDDSSKSCKAGCAAGTFRDSNGKCVVCGDNKIKSSNDLSDCASCGGGEVANDDHTKCVTPS